jgi:hypothetical protein
MLPPRKIIGTWSLDTFTITPPSGDEKPWGENVSGSLIYTNDGYMSVSINAKIDHSAPLKSLLFYAGTYELKDNTIIHNVTQATDPNRIGKTLERTVAFTDSGMMLTGTGTFGTAKLHWKPAPAKQHSKEKEVEVRRPLSPGNLMFSSE